MYVCLCASTIDLFWDRHSKFFTIKINGKNEILVFELPLSEAIPSIISPDLQALQYVCSCPAL
jgi:hypothetical protein